MRNDTKYKVGIFSPYLKTLGGGERYVFSIASLLSKEYKTYLYADKDIATEAFSRFGIFLKRVHFLPMSLFRAQNLLKRYFSLHQYELFIYMSDGSVFFSAAKKNLLIIQSPSHIPVSNLVNKLKLANWQILCYSQFMEEIIRKRLGSGFKIAILPPCIDIPTNQIKLAEKENIILTVGRFFPHPHDKKQKILVDIFKSGYRKYFSGWKLVIVGGLTESGGQKILAKLKKEAEGFPIEIKVNLPIHSLNKTYRHAKIYWHAAGFGEDLAIHPERAEHFGIAPLEAASYGSVPVVFNGGGLRDIITESEGGYLWNSPDELISKTHRLITDDKLFETQAEKAKIVASDYSCRKFYEKLEKIIVS